MEKPPKQTDRRSYRITRVYTRVGDGGRTSLVGGRIVGKDDPRIEAYGTVDELQVLIGAALGELTHLRDAPPHRIIGLLGSVADHLAYIHNLIFTANGELATSEEDQWEGMGRIKETDVSYLEAAIDRFNADLPPLADFILPGGDRAVVALHHCRVVCRRAERRLERLAQSEPIGPFTRPFLNRLSDLFFVMARRVAHDLRSEGLESEEQIWRRDLTPPPLPE